MDEIDPESCPPQTVAPCLPWDFHPALSEERLRICARLLANARRDALALAAYEMGDDSWSVGCRAYAFGRQRLKRVAESGTHPWLRVMDDSHHFVFLIEPVPVRFYRGLAEDPTVRTLRRHEAEAEQMSPALGGEVADGLVFRLAVQTNVGGGVERIVFLALRGEEGSAECAWSIPLELRPVRGQAGVQLRLIADDGYEGPSRAKVEAGSRFSRAAAAKTSPARVLTGTSGRLQAWRRTAGTVIILRRRKAPPQGAAEDTIFQAFLQVSQTRRDLW